MKKRLTDWQQQVPQLFIVVGKLVDMNGVPDPIMCACAQAWVRPDHSMSKPDPIIRACAQA